MAGISKFTLDMRVKILSSFVDGYTALEVADRCGINKGTLERWARKHKQFGLAIKRAKNSAMKSLIADTLIELAKGVEKSEETIEYFDTIKDKEGNEQKVKRTVRTRKLPPDIKALRMLAYKYAKGEYIDEEADKLGLEIRITTQDRGLSIEERKALIAKDAEAIEIIEDKDGVFGIPPSGKQG
jgi:transposase